jgi:hypothetical protein
VFRPTRDPACDCLSTRDVSRAGRWRPTRIEVQRVRSLEGVAVRERGTVATDRTAVRGVLNRSEGE